MKHSDVAAGLMLITTIVSLNSCTRGDVEIKTSPELLAARTFYATQPPYLRPLPVSKLPAGLPNLRAETCGTCHNEIYEEWKISSHARAWEGDPQFMEELKKTTATPGRDASWLCLSCHTPLESQIPKLVTGLENGDRGLPKYVDNPAFDAAMQNEGVTCATCHVRDGTILGPYGAAGAPHPVERSEDLLSASLCLTCHQVEEEFEEVDLVCVFDTGVTFAASPQAAEGKVCQSCHMPEVTRPAARNSPARPGRHHWFGGSLIPKKPEFEAELAPLRDVFPDGARVEWIDLPESVAPGRQTLTFAVTNAEAGHTLPTSDVERYLLITARALDDAGHVLGERTERIGTLYKWFPKTERVEDTRLNPRETRAFTLEFDAPSRGRVTLSLHGTNNRMSPENFAWHKLEGRSVANRVFLDESEIRPIR